ncbi:MAG: hypothetical protein ABI977_19810, partial [Acidobacteriota bacterium]
TRLKVQNEHGPIEVADVAQADLDGSFDSIRLDRVAGAATIDSQHGDVAVADVTGALTVNGRHGGLGILAHYAHIQSLYLYSFELLAVGFIILVIATLLKRA